jgi:hypothetical protein
MIWMYIDIYIHFFFCPVVFLPPDFSTAPLGRPKIEGVGDVVSGIISFDFDFFC